MDAVLGNLQRWFAAGAMALAGLGASWHADAQAVSEPAVKAAYLYKFAGYVEWPAPPSPDQPFVIAVHNADDVATELERLVANRAVATRRVVVKRARVADDIKGAQLLFVARADVAARELIRLAQRQGTVTVTDVDRGLELGSVINLVTLEDRIGFEVSLEAAERTGVAVSSRMLGVARRVVPRG